MRRRLFGIVAILGLLLAAFPAAASAQGPDFARLSATSYLDLAGYETDALCDVFSEEGEPSIEAVLRWSGSGANLGGSGTGDAVFTLSEGSFFVVGEFILGDDVTYLAGVGELLCLGGTGIVLGEFYTSDEPIEVDEGGFPADPTEEDTCGDMAGYIMDGAHPNQGRVSLTLSGAEECEVEDTNGEEPL